MDSRRTERCASLPFDDMLEEVYAILLAGLLNLLNDATFRGLLDSAPDGMIVVAPDGKILVANSQMEELFGYGRDELIGQRPEMLVPNESRNTHLAHRTHYEGHPTLRAMGSGLSLKGRRKDGSELPVEISLSPRVTPDGTLIVAAVRDITDRQRLESERSALIEAALARNERERIAMDLHDGIIQSIFGVGLGLEIAADEASGTNAAPLVEKAIDQLNDVIRDIRAYIFELRPMAYDGNLTDSLHQLAGALRASSPITIDVEIEADLVGIDESVALAMFQIVQETLANARKHSQAKHVRLEIHSTQDAIVARVTDDGVGFDATAERDETHRGLRNLTSRADSLGGRLEIESAPGRGTTISLFVPVS
jgi:PAS domain S-box-containing protein